MSSANFSFENKFLSKKDYEKIMKHLIKLKISSNLNHYLKKKHINLIIKYMKSDKKNNSSKINLILIKKIGKVILGLTFNIKKIEQFFKKKLIY